MSDGNTLIGNALVGHGLDQGGEAPTQGDTYLAAEEAVIAQAEEHMMSHEDSIEDDEKMERQMLAVALVTSVVETSQQSPDPDKNSSSSSSSSSDQDAKQRYSLRKRRRPSGEQALVAQPGANPPSVKVEPSSTPSSEPPPTSSALSQPPQALPSVKQEGAPKAKQTTTRIQIKAPSPLPPPPSQPLIAKVKTEAVPACTVAVAAASLSIPLAASSLPKPSSLPPALQPPPRNSLPPMPPPKAATASRAATKSKSAKDKSKRLVPAARVPATSQPLTPNPAAIGVPNPLSNPLPASSKSILVSKPKNAPPPPNAAVAAAAPAAAFKAGAKLTVPCPLPPSTFQNSASQATALAPAADTEAAVAPAPEKKKVTIDLPPQQRGRIFSIDLDPASLDFSVLDSGESGTPAPASADLPLVTGGARDRAFSFECFAFGINADEPLPPLAEQAAAEHDGSLAQQQDFVTLPRPRGDSIIFDPSSFQEGGIHEEHALTTRKTRGMSVDLEASGLLPPSTESTAIAATPDVQGQNYLSEHPPHHPGALPQTAPSASVPVAHPGSLPPPPPPGPPLPSHPDTAPSSLQTSAAPPPHAHMGHPHPAPPPPPHHHHHHAAHPGAAAAPPPPTTTATHAYHHPGQPTAGIPHPVASATPDAPQAGGAVSIISSCASSTTLQMELLNKDGRIGIYLPEARKERIARFHAKRKMRIWRKRIKYDCRKKLADSRPRIKGRFVKRSGTD